MAYAPYIIEMKKTVEEATGYTVDNIELGSKEITMFNNELGVIAIYKRRSGKLVITQ